MKWYTLRVATGKERKLEELIKKEIEINNMDKYFGQVLIPKEKIYKVKNGKRIKTERAYLPGYLIIEAKLNGELRELIKGIKGVYNFLGQGSPTPLKQNEVNRILGKIDELEEIEDDLILDNFTKGERLKLTNGAFNGFYGDVIKIDESKKKLTLNVKIFNRDTPVEISFNDVERDY